MKTKSVYIHDLHFDHKRWLNELGFYGSELSIFESRLEELVTKYSISEMLRELEHFQNQFIRQKEVMDQLRHDINKAEQNLSDFAVEHPVAVDHVHFKDHAGLKDEMVQFHKIYSELKNEFVDFLARYM